jgi:hypothetical protein
MDFGLAEVSGHDDLGDLSCDCHSGRAEGPPLQMSELSARVVTGRLC